MDRGHLCKIEECSISHQNRLRVLNDDNYSSSKNNYAPRTLYDMILMSLVVISGWEYDAPVGSTHSLAYWVRGADTTACNPSFGRGLVYDWQSFRIVANIPKNLIILTGSPLISLVDWLAVAYALSHDDWVFTSAIILLQHSSYQVSTVGEKSSRPWLSISKWEYWYCSVRTEFTCINKNRAVKAAEKTHSFFSLSMQVV